MMTSIIIRWPKFLKKGAQVRGLKLSIIGHPYWPHGTGTAIVADNSHLLRITHIQTHYWLYRDALVLLGNLSPTATSREENLTTQI
jgi:hypothetical protein